MTTNSYITEEFLQKKAWNHLLWLKMSVEESKFAETFTLEQELAF